MNAKRSRQRNRNPRVARQERMVEWWIEEATPGERVQTPWGVIWLGEEVGGGQEVGVAADEAFMLVVHGRTASFVEQIAPGYQRLLLTVLDRTDVQ